MFPDPRCINRTTFFLIAIQPWLKFFYCYQVAPLIYCHINVTTINNARSLQTDKFSLFAVSISERLPHFDPTKTISLHAQLVEQDLTTNILSTYHQIETSKLKYPYTDDCIDYTMIGSSGDQYSTIHDCYRNKTNMIPLQYSLIENKKHNLDMKIDLKPNMKIMDKCSRRYSNSDCLSNKFYTSTKLTRANDTGTTRAIIMITQFAHHASFIIVSKPRIDHIDYFSFILGTFGAWLGLSVLSLNPFPLIFTKSTNSSISTVTINDMRMFEDEITKKIDAKYEKRIKLLQIFVSKHNSNIKDLYDQIK